MNWTFFTFKGQEINPIISAFYPHFFLDLIWGLVQTWDDIPYIVLAFLWQFFAGESDDQAMAPTYVDDHQPAFLLGFFKVLLFSAIILKSFADNSDHC